MRRKIYFLFLGLMLPFIGSSQIFSNDITGTDPGLVNPFTNGQFTDGNVTVTGVGRGTGVSGNVGDDRYNGRGWNSTMLDNTDFFEFTISPNSGYKLSFTALVYSSQASGTGPTSFSFRSSLDGFTSEIASPISTGGTIDLSGPSFQNITTSITFRLYGWGATSSAGTFSINDFEFQGSVPLPIELISFSGNENNGQVLLSWTTGSELHADFISVERSVNNMDFREIGKVDAQGTSFFSKNYEFIDPNPYPGTNYYRLKETSLDGQVTVHNVIAVSVPKSENIASIYPSNPQHTLWLDPGSGAIEKLWIVFANGKSQPIRNFNLEGISTIDISHLVAGAYFLIISHPNGKQQSLKFFKS